MHGLLLFCGTVAVTTAAIFEVRQSAYGTAGWAGMRVGEACYAHGNQSKACKGLIPASCMACCCFVAEWLLQLLQFLKCGSPPMVLLMGGQARGLGKLAMHMTIKARPVRAKFQHNTWPVAVLWHSGCYSCCNSGSTRYRSSWYC